MVPYHVVKSLSAVTYRMQKNKQATCKVVHYNRLWKIRGPPRFSWRCTPSQEPAPGRGEAAGIAPTSDSTATGDAGEDTGVAPTSDAIVMEDTEEDAEFAPILEAVGTKISWIVRQNQRPGSTINTDQDQMNHDLGVGIPPRPIKDSNDSAGDQHTCNSMTVIKPTFNVTISLCMHWCFVCCVHAADRWRCSCALTYHLFVLSAHGP